MDGFGKSPDFLAGGEVGKAASSNPSFHSIRHPSPWVESEVIACDPVTMSELTSSDAVRAWRKRQNDRRYREKLRLGKLQMKTEFDFLHVENENLKKQNERLQCEHVSMNGTLQAQAKLIDQLKSDLDKLNDEHTKQNVLVQRLSELLACPDLQLENERLKLENVQLRLNSSLEYNMVLAEENVKLKLENKVLKVQNDALCGKLVSDSDKKHT